MFINNLSNQKQTEPYLQPAADSAKSPAEQEFLSIINELQSSQPKMQNGDLRMPYTLPSSSGESIQERTATLEKIFEETLKEIMKERGIESDPPFELATASDGHVYVKGNHPAKAEIEDIFSDNPEFENLFRGISGNHELIAALDTHVKFSEDYAINQLAAVMKWAYLFSDSNKYNASMSIDSDGNIVWSAVQSTV